MDGASAYGWRPVPHFGGSAGAFHRLAGGATRHNLALVLPRLWSVVLGAFAGGVVGALVVRRKQATHADREVAQLRDERERQWERVQKIVRGAAHDLRNPLTTIRARAELLKRSLGNGQSSEGRHLDAILRSSERLEAQIAHLSTSFREGTATDGPLVEAAKEAEPTPH